MAVCATRIGVVRGRIQETYHNLTASVLSAGNPSSWSMPVLQRANLFESFGDDPEGALGALRKTIQQHGTADRFSDRLFALSELSFYFADRSGKNEHFLAAAVYAYAFDPRRRLAADLYNLGLIRGLASPVGGKWFCRQVNCPCPSVNWTCRWISRAIFGVVFDLSDLFRWATLSFAG